MADYYLGEIRIFAGNYAPTDWAVCDGSTLPISQNETLFSLLGTTWGGDGVNTFKLPDFRSRLAIGAGQGTNLTNRVLGQTGGTEQVTLTEANLPTHTHSFNASSSAADTQTVANNVALAKTASGVVNYIASTVTATTQNFNTNTISQALGGGLSHENSMPATALNFIICTTGLYPQPQ